MSNDGMRFVYQNKMSLFLCSGQGDPIHGVLSAFPLSFEVYHFLGSTCLLGFCLDDFKLSRDPRWRESDFQLGRRTTWPISFCSHVSPVCPCHPSRDDWVKVSPPSIRNENFSFWRVNLQWVAPSTSLSRRCSWRNTFSSKFWDMMSQIVRGLYIATAQYCSLCVSAAVLTLGCDDIEDGVSDREQEDSERGNVEEREKQERDKLEETTNARSNIWHHGWHVDGVRCALRQLEPRCECHHMCKVHEKNPCHVYLSTLSRRLQRIAIDCKRTQLYQKSIRKFLWAHFQFHSDLSHLDVLEEGCHRLYWSEYRLFNLVLLIRGVDDFSQGQRLENKIRSFIGPFLPALFKVRYHCPWYLFFSSGVRGYVWFSCANSSHSIRLRVVIHDELDLWEIDREYLSKILLENQLSWSISSNAFEDKWYSVCSLVFPCRAPWQRSFFITHFGMESASSLSL